MQATIEFRDWRLPISLGHYASGDTVPEWHAIDVTLTVDPGLVFIDRDAMDAIWDYDPLRDHALDLAAERHWETQERFVTRLAEWCARQPGIFGIEIAMRKAPIANGSGCAGVRLVLGPDDIAALAAS